MILWITIITLLCLGVILIVLEIIFIPGTTIVGLLGVIFSIAGIVICYRKLGGDVATFVLAALAVVIAGALYYSFRSNAWSKFSLKSAMTSRVKEDLTSVMHVGDEGKTISALRPMGKAEFKNFQVEVKSLGEYIEGGTRIRIRQIDVNQIVVEPIN